MATNQSKHYQTNRVNTDLKIRKSRNEPEHEHAAQACNARQETESGSNANRMEEFTRAQLIGMYKKARNRTSRRFEIFTKEIECLTIIGLYLQENQRKTFDSDNALKYGGFIPWKRKSLKRNIEALANKGLLIRVKYKRGKGAHEGAHGYALSEIGLKALNDLDQNFQDIERWHRENKNRRRLEDCVLYLDKVHEYLGPFQSVILTAEQEEQIKRITI